MTHPTTIPADDAASTARPTGFSKLLRSVFMTPATLADARCVAGRFYLLTLHGAKFADAAWAAGQKVQVAMGAGVATRTYTPIDWNPAQGTIRILGYAHGDGLGSAWLAAARPGLACDVFGPRASLDLGRVAGEVVVFGDETSIGLVAALRHEGRQAAAVLEVGDVAGAAAVVRHLGLDAVQLVPRAADGAHLAGFGGAVDEDASFVLTGNAQSIQRWRQMLKAAGVAGNRMLAKAYWAAGKTGLD